MPTKKPTTREPLFLESPSDLEDPAAQKKLADAVGDAMVAMVQADRKARGLPPLPEK